MEESRWVLPIRRAACLALLTLVAMVWFAGLVTAAPPLKAATAAPAAAPAPPPSSLQKSLAPLADRYAADAKAVVGLHVIRLSDGAVLCDVRGDQPLIPASNQKIVSSAVALKRLGRDFEFKTNLYLVGKDVLVVGDLDPTLGDERLAKAANESIYAVLDGWASALKQAGVKEIQELVLEHGIFRDAYAHPDWPADQLNRWYGAGLAGLNFNDNCMDVSFVVSGAAVSAVLSPQTRFLEVQNQVRVGKQDAWSLRFNANGTKATLAGTVVRGSGEPQSIAVPEPPVLLGMTLAERLTAAGLEIKAGINITGAGWPALPKDARLIATASTPLGNALFRANKFSLNMMAEAMFLRSSVELNTPATWERAAAVARKTLIADYGLDGAQFSIADGSGLGRGNRISPANLTRLLRALVNEPRFTSALPVAGVDGSLQKRSQSWACKGRVIAKTGYISNVSALSGYVLDGDGRPVLAFSTLVNGPTWGQKQSARGLHEDICETLTSYVDQTAATSGR